MVMLTLMTMRVKVHLLAGWVPLVFLEAKYLLMSFNTTAPPACLWWGTRSRIAYCPHLNSIDIRETGG
jgi:hypothetical protein